LLVDGPFLGSLYIEIIFVIAKHRDSNDNEKQKPIQKMPAEAELRRPHYISCSLSVLVMAEVVTRDVVANRMSVSNCQNRLDNLVWEAFLEHRAVDDIVHFGQQKKHL